MTNQDEVREEFLKKFEYKDKNDVGYFPAHRTKEVADWWLAKFDTLLAKKREEVEKLMAPNRQNPKAIRVAEAVGKQPTNTGPIAVARSDGYKVGLSDVIKILS